MKIFISFFVHSYNTYNLNSNNKYYNEKRRCSTGGNFGGIVGRKMIGVKFFEGFILNMVLNQLSILFFVRGSLNSSRLIFSNAEDFQWQMHGYNGNDID